MARIFAYIMHKGGVADDSAFELAAAARRDRSRCFTDSHSHRLGRRTSMPRAKPSALPTLRSGKSPTKLLRTPMLN